jgi:phosphoribosylamine--glycine ligase
MKNILIIGNGGREHAIAWKVRQSPQANKVYVAPGNAGTALEPGIENIPIGATDIQQLLHFAQTNHIDLTIVGPEAPLAAGVVDLFSQQGLACFGPTAAAARLESSKVFSKHFMREHQIPTADYANFSDLSLALDYLETCTYPVVIKADGLAAGKGVVIANNQSAAVATLQSMLNESGFGASGKQVVIETFIRGEEASFIVVADGEFALPLATSQDHKTRDNADQGPNTGGMGAYSPASIVSAALQEKIMQKVIYPTLKGLAAQGSPYTGFLYAGIMLTPEGEPYVLEFNCRLGDPETQPILMRLQSDLVTLCSAALEKQLHTLDLQWDSRPALGVVMAAKGYPDSYPKNDVIENLSVATAPLCKVFHAGTLLDHQQVKTNGGRVLCVTALGDTVKEAQTNAYTVVKDIHWGNEYYRTDIGYKAILKEDNQ